MTDLDRIARLRHALERAAGALDWAAAGRPIDPQVAAAAAEDARKALDDTMQDDPNTS